MASYKVISFVIALVAVSNSQPTEPRGPILDMVIRQALEGLKPKLKDLEIPRKELSVNQPGINITASFDKGLVKHLDEFVIAKLTTKILPLQLSNLTITLDQLKITGLYKVDGYVQVPELGGNIHIFGDGDADIELKGIFFTIASDFVFEGGKFQIPPNGLHGFDMYLTESKFNLTNLMGGGTIGNIVNSYISNNLPKLIQENKTEIGKFVTQRLRSIINSFLKLFGLPKSDYPSSYPNCG